MKKALLILFCATAFIWGGCSDDDESAFDTANLIGKWECYKYYDEEYDEWDYEFGEGVDLFRLNFREDGICVITDDYSSDEFHYKLEGKKILLYDSSHPDETEEIRINKLTASELVLAYDYIGDNGRNYTDKEYFKRID